MQIIAFNGPPRSGKTHITSQVIQQAPLFVSAQRLNYVDAIYEPAIILMSRLHGSVPHDAEIFKEYDFGGYSGRDVIISLVNAMKKHNPNVLIDAMDRQLMSAWTRNVKLAIIENVGSPGEWEAIQSFSKRMLPGNPLPSPMLFGLRERRPDSQVTYAGALEPVYHGATYAHGTRFSGDSRVSYANDYKFINPSVDEILSLCGFEV